MSKPIVVADLPLSQAIEQLLVGQVELLPWSVVEQSSVSGTTVDALYTYGHPIVDGAMLDRFPGIKVISNNGVGVDHIDLVAAAARGIPVGNTPGVLDGATADMGFSLVLATGRRIVECDRIARSPEYSKHHPGSLMAREVHHATIGIIGMGRIGFQVARRASGFDMPVLYHNRNRRSEIESQINAKYVSMDELLKTSDYVVLTVPLSDATRGLIGARELSLMKPTAALINIARGPVVDTEALTNSLTSGQIRAAGLDVTDPEPLPRDHPLLKMNNVTITPHVASATVQTRQSMAELSVANLMAGLHGQSLPSEIRP